MRNNLFIKMFVVVEKKNPENNLNVQAQLNYRISLLKMAVVIENIYNEFNNDMGELFMI